MDYSHIKLKSGREKSVNSGHPWIFSGAISSDTSSVPPGSIVQVLSSRNELLGLGTYNPNTSIAIRMFSKELEIINIQTIAQFLSDLCSKKQALLDNETTGFRICHAEEDGFPGLILDKYDDTMVFQLHTYGADLLRETILQALIHAFSPRSVFERSDVSARKLEGLSQFPSCHHFGDNHPVIKFKEHGLTFMADVLHGQKTGFFLDQRDARDYLGRISEGKSILNLFSYSGGFSIYAASHKAKRVDSVDLSEHALAFARENYKLNSLQQDQASFIQEDSFIYLDQMISSNSKYDIVICDPPAFAKHAANLTQATKAYERLNTLCLSIVNPGGILISSSCSGRLGEEGFKSILSQALRNVKRKGNHVYTLGQAFDHTQPLAFSEATYLKTLVIQVD